MFRLDVAPGIQLRQFELRDADPAFEAVERNRAYLRQFLPWVDPTRSPDDIREFILRTLAQHDANQGPQCGIWIEGKFSGSFGCHPIDWANRNCSIGYWVDAARQGQGVVTRCCTAMLDWLFDEMSLHRVEIRCATANTRSCAVAERLGFTREGVSRESEWVNDRFLDLVVWGILEPEWRMRKRS
jgi:ribosomal-protein-serine acetyltransferase